MAALAIGAMALSSPAWATLEVNFGGTNNGTTITGGTTCVDNAACDTNATVGILSTNVGGALGTITVSGSTTTSSHTLADLSIALNGAINSTGTFHISITDTGYTIPAPPIQMNVSVTGLSAVGGPQGSLTAVGFFGATNALFDTSGVATSTASTNVNAAAGTGQSAKITGATPYSLTDYITVNVTSVGTGSSNLQVNSDVSTSSVPEPTTISLLGGAMLLAATALKRKFQN